MGGTQGDCWASCWLSLRLRAVDCDLCGAGLHFRATSARARAVVGISKHMHR